MFKVFLILLELATGKVQPMLDETTSFPTYKACVADLQRRFEELRPNIEKGNFKIAVALGCTRAPSTDA